MPLIKSDIRTDEQLKEDGLNVADIREFRRAEGSYYVLQAELDTANAAKDWDTVLDIEPKIEKLEFKLKYQGKNPRDIPLVELKAFVNNRHHTDLVIKNAYGRIKNPGTSIRAYCISCMGGQPAEVRHCPATHCALWPFRLGANPFFGKTFPPIELAEDYTVLEEDDLAMVEEEGDTNDAD